MDNTQVWNHYALIDPRIADPILSVRYVGRTMTALGVRLRNHLCLARNGDTTHRSNWIRKLQREGVEPLIWSVGIGDDNFESELILCYRGNGAKLTNATSGGDGVRDRLPESTAKWRAAISTPENKAKRSLASRTAYACPETIERHSTALRKAWSTPEAKEILSRAAKRRWANPDYRLKQSEAMKVTFSSPEVKAAMSERSKAVHARPEVKAKHIASIREAFSRPEARERRSLSHKIVCAAKLGLTAEQREERDEEISNLFDSGIRYADIAKRYNITYSQAVKATHRHRRARHGTFDGQLKI